MSKIVLEGFKKQHSWNIITSLKQVIAYARDVIDDVIIVIELGTVKYAIVKKIK